MTSIRLMLIMILPVAVHINAADKRESNKQLYNALLHKASWEKVKELVDKHGANIKGVEEHSMFKIPALNHVTSTHDKEIMLYLIDRGADVNAKDVDGVTACHCAAACNRADLVEILFNNGADVNAKNRYRSTPLHSACTSGSLKTVKVLLLRGAHIQVKNDDGETPIDAARIQGHHAVADFIEDWESIPKIKEPEVD